MKKNYEIFSLDSKWHEKLAKIQLGIQSGTVLELAQEEKNLLSVDYLNPRTGACERASSEVVAGVFASTNLNLTSPQVESGNVIGIINIKGVLDYSWSWILDYIGGSSYEQIAKAFKFLLNDPAVGLIVLKIQSPGGTVFGCAELSELIYNGRSEKRIVAFADPYAFSAGYWLATAAEELYTIRSGMVGSVGAYTEHWDYSKLLDNEGIKVTFISAGEKKVDGNYAEPLSEEAKADIQLEINEYYRMFVSDLARNRGVESTYVEEHFGRGGTVMAESALAAGMIDGIITFDELLLVETESLQKVSAGLKNKAYFENCKKFLEIEG